MEKLLEKNEDVLSQREKARLIRRIEEMKEERENTLKISEELYKLLKEKAKREGKTTDKFVEEILIKVI